LHQHLEVRLDELADTLGNEGYPFLTGYYFYRYADYQISSSGSCFKAQLYMLKSFYVPVLPIGTNRTVLP